MAKIVIVDKKDKVIGAEEKEAVQQKGLIHRIIRIILVNSKGQIYLQKRGHNKSTWPNRWDQSVGGHVDEGEDYKKAALREAKEELGIANLSLKPLARFFQNEAGGNFKMKRFNMLYEAKYDGKITSAQDEISGGS